MRLYGAVVGHGSWPRVTGGVRGALERAGRLEGFVPLDAIDPDRAYPGFDRDVAVLVGSPKSTAAMFSMGQHKQRHFVLAPNSSWLPEEMLFHIERYITHYIAPSAWAKNVIESYTKLPVSVWNHGVDSGFIHSGDDNEYLKTEYGKGKFSVLHMTSTTRHRKGTYELIDAWSSAVRRNMLGKNPLLRIVVEGPTDALHSAINDASVGDMRTIKSVVIAQRMNIPIAQTAKVYRTHHLVCQPSRGEGFGMVPLEARACGSLVAATACTGHADHIRPEEYAMMVIRHGDSAPIDDGPGATAPSVDPTDIESTLCEAYEGWRELSNRAFSYATEVHDNWNWNKVTKKWLGTLE